MSETSDCDSWWVGPIRHAYGDRVGWLEDGTEARRYLNEAMWMDDRKVPMKMESLEMAFATQYYCCDRGNGKGDGDASFTSEVFYVPERTVGWAVMGRGFQLGSLDCEKGIRFLMSMVGIDSGKDEFVLDGNTGRVCVSFRFVFDLRDGTMYRGRNLGGGALMLDQIGCDFDEKCIVRSDGVIAMQCFSRLRCPFCVSRQERCECASTIRERSMNPIRQSFQSWKQYLWFQKGMFGRGERDFGAHYDTDIYVGVRQSCPQFQQLVLGRFLFDGDNSLQRMQSSFGWFMSPPAPGSDLLFELESLFDWDDPSSNLHEFLEASKESGDAGSLSDLKPLTRTLYKCAICLASFSCSSNLRRHEATIHAGQSQFVCGVCQRSFSQRSNLLRHMQAVHEKKQMWGCDHCPAKFSTQGNASRHMRTRHARIVVPLE